MRTLLLVLSLLLTPAAPAQNGGDAGSPVTVVGSRWFKHRQAVEQLVPPNKAPAAEMIPANRNFQRNARINDPVGARDPNADSIDGRSAAIEKNVQEARTPKAKPVDGFAYRVKLRNAGEKRVVEVVFWEYQFAEAANPANVVRRQFLCGVEIKPDKEKELQAFSTNGPDAVISVGTLADKPANPFQEKVLINRVEFSDGTIWQRKDWNFAEVKANIARAVATPWGTEMCRGL